MTLTIENAEAERLLAEIVKLTGESEMEALRTALDERKMRLAPQRAARLMAFLENEVWPNLPDDQRGIRLSKADEERLLGYGE